MRYIVYGNSFILKHVFMVDAYRTWGGAGMAKAIEFIDEALGILNSFRNGIESRVLSKASTLKPSIVSVAQNIIEVASMMSKVLELARNKARDLDEGDVVVVDPWWSISVYSDRILVTRHKPLTASVSYNKSKRTVTFRSKVMKLEVSIDHVLIQKLGAKVVFNPSDPNDLGGKVNTIRYMLRDVARALELMSIIAARRLL